MRKVHLSIATKYAGQTFTQIPLTMYHNYVRHSNISKTLDKNTSNK